MQYLHWKKIVLIPLLFLGLSLSLYAQKKKTYGTTRVAQNLPNYDNRKYHYGFTLGLNSARYKVTPSSVYLATDTILSVLPKAGGAFSLGFVVSRRLGDYFDLRLLPTFAYYSRVLEYQFAGRGAVQLTTENAFIEFPLLVKYKSQRRKNLRMYLVSGIKPGIEVGSKKKDRKSSELRTNNIDFSVDYGFGFDIYYPLFKFSPELRISHGFVNMLNSDPNEYSRSINVLMTHTVTLYLHFE